MSATGEQAQAGYTLIEILVAFAILGMVSAIGFASGERALDRLALAQDQTALAGALREARADALAGGRPVAFAIGAGGRAFGWSGQAPRWLGGDVSAASDRPATVFFADGESTGGRFVLAAGKARATIAVDPATGAVEAL